MPKPAQIFIRLAAIVVVSGLALGVCLAALVPGVRQIALAHHYTGSVKSLGELSQPTLVYDANGTQIGKLGVQDREPVELAEVPQILINAVIATEDKTFWKNPGIDVSGVSRAFLENLTEGKISQGGSTITQQLVKNRILGNKRDLQRKAKELILAYRLNDKYSKREILKQYLNTVYFGQGSYGVKAATRRFFRTLDPAAPLGVRGKELNELTVGEAALLAGVIRNPEGDNPFVHPERTIERRAEVLKGMVSQHYITQAQADEANQEQMPTVKPSSELRPDNAWAEKAQEVLLSDPRLGATPQERRDKVLQGGLKVYTTKDPSLQQMADVAVANGLQAAKPGFGAALVAMDPKTGYVRAMTDSRPYGAAEFNLATDGAGRQVGSSFKVTTLATILQNGYSRNDQINGNAPCSVAGFDGATNNAGGEGEGGIMSVDDATAESVNCAFVRLSTSVGLDKVIDMAQKLGMRPNVAGRQPVNDWDVLTFTLGVISITPLEMANIAATIADGGIHHDPIFVSKVVGPDGKVVFDETGRPGTRVLDPDVAACEVSILHGPIDSPRGTASGKGIPGHDAFGKTGTNDNKISSAFLGGTPDLVSFVWHGVPEQDVPGAGFGAQIPNTIWRNFMIPATQGGPDDAFPVPGPACDAPGKVIDPVLGRTTDIPKPTTPPPTEATPSPPEPEPAPAPAPAPGPAQAPATVPAPAADNPAAGAGPGGGGGGG
ncbi:MAG TPA: transglycosylase domain-containing protein [Acidimicrobiia bacterium]|jgi:membrane peptidoglycan carboxypeptidase|nr:transglycosylase domain-containing protein [Acidimicrobiia bacterium]